MDTPDEMQKRVSDARNFITWFAANPCSRSTPHIYISSYSAFAHCTLHPHPSPSPAHAPSMQDTHMVSVEDPTKETVEVFKNLKPLGFKGEDKE